MSSVDQTDTTLYISTFCATQLPEDCISHIFSFNLSFHDRRNFGRTCRQLNSQLKSNTQCFHLSNDTSNPEYECAKKMLRDPNGDLNQPVANNQTRITGLQLTSKKVNNFLNSFKASLFPQLTSLELTGQLSLTRFPRLVKQLNSLSQLTTLTLCISFEMESYRKEFRLTSPYSVYTTFWFPFSSFRPPALLHLTLAIVEDASNKEKTDEFLEYHCLPPSFSSPLIAEQLESFHFYTALQLPVLCQLISRSVALNAKLSAAEGSLRIAFNTKHGGLAPHNTDNWKEYIRSEEFTAGLARLTSVELPCDDQGKLSTEQYLLQPNWLPSMRTLRLVIPGLGAGAMLRFNNFYYAAEFYLDVLNLLAAVEPDSFTLQTLLIDLPCNPASAAADENTFGNSIIPPPPPPSIDQFPFKALPPTLTTVEIANFSSADHDDVVWFFRLNRSFPGLRRLKVHFRQIFCWACQQLPCQLVEKKKAGCANNYQHCGRQLIVHLQASLPATVLELKLSFEFRYNHLGCDSDANCKAVVKYSSLENMLADVKE